MSPRDLILALCVVTVWGLSFVAIRWGVDEVAPLLMTALRYTFAAVPAVFFVRRPDLPWRTLIAYGFAIGVGQFGLLFVAVKWGMPPGLGSIVVQLQVFFTIGLAMIAFGERPKPIQWLGALVAFGGIGVIALERLDGAALLPLLMTVVAAFFWAIGNTVTKQAGKIDMLGFVVWSSLIPPLPLLALSLLIEGPGAIPAAVQHITWIGGGSLLFMAWCATLFGYGTWSVLLSRYPAGLVAPFALLVPISGIGASALLLGETISGLEIAGSVLVFVGLLLNVFGPRLLARFRLSSS
jgi:O-acetylserine/cysteine efflux transporter